MKAALLLVIFLFSVGINALNLRFSSNITLSKDAEGEHQFRKTTASSLSVLGGHFFHYTSLSVGKTKYSADVDAILGGVKVGYNFPPIAYLLFATADVNWDIFDLAKLDFSAAASVVGGAFLAIVEVDPQGKIVQTFDLTSSLLNPWVVEGSGVQQGDGLKWITYQINYQSGRVAITYVVPEVVGVLNVGAVAISPRSLESIVEIKDWPYKNNDNHLKLVVATASASGTLTGNVLVSGEGVKKVYATVAGEAIISGNPQTVQITARIDSDAASELVSQIKAAVNAIYKSDVSVAVFDVEFPAGASDIVYDPTIGQGEPLGGAAGTLSVTFFALIALVVLAMLF